MIEQLPQGGEFLLNEAYGSSSFSPEDFTSEQKQIGATTEEFVKNEILPDMERLESQDFGLVVEKMRSCGDLGLFLADIPEDYGGLELDKATAMLLIEKMAPAGSFSITYGGQTGIGSLPIVYYGTKQQKERYLEKLASGEWIGAYALTEPDCGSDPLSSRTTAILSEDGRHYVLNGVKQFITNSSFADIFTVFAKIDGKHFTAFLVEKGYAGFSVGAEEKKMGLKGSSTTQLILDNVKVPVENLLGEPGKGHKIAFNVLNIGRLKVAATTSGMAKGAFAEAAGYATERKQFGQPIGEFGAIKEKLADMTAAIFAAESVVYRIAGLLDNRIATLDRRAPDYYAQYQKAIEEYAVECAIAKVFGSESLDGVVDEAVQIHGGYGYVSEYPVERYYRDSRIQRIFEGTNEINRILIPTLLLRRAESGDFNLWDRVAAAQAQLDAKTDMPAMAPGPLGVEFTLLAGQKQLLLALLGQAREMLNCQEVLLAVADMAIGIFALESVLQRVAKIWERESNTKRELLLAVARVASFDRAGQFRLAATRCGAYVLEGEALSALQQDMNCLAGYPLTGLLPAKQLLAEAAKEAGRYVF